MPGSASAALSGPVSARSQYLVDADQAPSDSQNESDQDPNQLILFDF